jgi:hypothetical protein
LREPGSRTRIPDRWPSCHARHRAGRRGGERSATEIFKITPEIAEYQQRFSRLISHRVPWAVRHDLLAASDIARVLGAI